MQEPPKIPSSEITPKETYLNRRTFLQGAALVGGIAASAGIYRYLNHRAPGAAPGEKLAPATIPGPDQVASTSMTPVDRAASGFITDEPKTPYDTVTGYNNYYEFSLDKEGVAGAARNFTYKPWTIKVDGLVSNPRTFDLDQINKLAPLEERIYRHRCVEAWSMVIPWLGIPISALLNAVQPLSSAKYVAFQTLLDPKRMPNQSENILDWPYVEGLRMDEAMHPLAILATGLYGETLPPQNGTPLRTVIPWKYGFKGTKSIVKISLLAEQPATTWNLANPREYGFYSNVNPAVDHPRWSQATERRLPTFAPRPTLPFNGYGAQVAHLYAGMDLVRNY